MALIDINISNLNSLKVGDVIQHYVSGVLVKAVIKEIAGRQILTSHNPVQWGNDFYTRSLIYVRGINCTPLAYLN